MCVAFQQAVIVPRACKQRARSCVVELVLHEKKIANLLPRRPDTGDHDSCLIKDDRVSFLIELKRLKQGSCRGNLKCTNGNYWLFEQRRLGLALQPELCRHCNLRCSNRSSFYFFLKKARARGKNVTPPIQRSSIEF